MAKTFNRTSLPDSITHNNKVFKLNIEATHGYAEHHKAPQHSVIVKVLSNNLKNRTDLHGKPYQPSVFVFTPVQVDDRTKEDHDADNCEQFEFLPYSD